MPPLLHSIELKNLLSCGDDAGELQLKSLNVFIGPNASGKSNLIAALSLLAATPGDLHEPVRQGGGIGEWLWKGGAASPIASIDAIVNLDSKRSPLRYKISFSEQDYRFILIDEAIELVPPSSSAGLYRYERDGEPTLWILTEDGHRKERSLAGDEIKVNQSILAQRRDASLYPELTHLSSRFSGICFFRTWNLGYDSPARRPQKVDMPEDFLLEDASNLAIVLHNLMSDPAIKDSILERLRDLYSDIEEVTTKLQGGTVQIFFYEKGLRQPVPSTRLSDGALHFLCLLSILYHPDPPPLICIEEPELGLHPDAISTLGEMLLEAADRTQLIVTTHSDILINAFSDVPETVVVTERDHGGTRFHRLEPDSLSHWLDRYRLGEIWRIGEIGGNP